MKKINFVFCLALLVISLTVSAQTPLYKIFLIGDAGDDEMTGQTLDSLHSHLMRNPNSSVFFLGDNSYRHLWPFDTGFKGFDSSMVTQRKVHTELDILNGYKGAAYFVPGNHDWWNITKINKGKRKLKLEENFVEQNLSKNTSIQNPNNTFLPKDGTPGPASVEVDNGKVKVVFIDTYWLILLGFKKNQAEYLPLERTFYHQLDSLLADGTAKKQKIMVLSHHPVYYPNLDTTTTLRHIHLPKRVATSLPWFPAYRKMSAQVTAILNKYPGAYFASGHLHAMQYRLSENNIHYIISGAGSKIHHVSKKELADAKPCTEKECILWNEKGFFELDLYADKEKIIIYHDEGKKKTEL